MEKVAGEFCIKVLINDSESFENFYVYEIDIKQKTYEVWNELTEDVVITYADGIDAIIFIELTSDQSFIVRN